MCIRDRATNLLNQPLRYYQGTKDRTMQAESYPNDYFESLHYDFISRCDGDEWPE